MSDQCAQCPWPDYILSSHALDLDATVAICGRTGRATLQSADVLLYRTPDQDPDVLVIGELFDRYPGCVVVAVSPESASWCLLAVRGAPPVRVTLGSHRWCGCQIEAAARTLYDVAGRRAL